MPHHYRKFAVTMGQAFYDALPRELERLGAVVVDVDRGPTEVEVTARFSKARAPETVQKLLWQKWPACSIGVVGRN